MIVAYQNHLKQHLHTQNSYVKSSKINNRYDVTKVPLPLVSSKQGPCCHILLLRSASSKYFFPQ